MNEYPRLVYKNGGPHSRKGGTYSYIGVDNDIDKEKAIEAGWFDSIEAAVEATKDTSEAKTATQEPNEKLTDNAPVLRSELEAKAKELKIIFNGKTSDASLLGRIEKALKEISDVVD